MKVSVRCGVHPGNVVWRAVELGTIVPLCCPRAYATVDDEEKVMSFKFSDYVKFLQYLPFIDKFAAILHDATDKDSTKDKAADVLEDVIQIAIDATAVTSPALSAEISAAYAVIKPELDKLKDKAA